MDAEKRRVAKRPQIEAIMRPIFSLKYGPMKKYNVSYQRWEERTIYGKTSPQSSITTVTSLQQRIAKPKFTTWNKSTKKQKFRLNSPRMNATATVISSFILQPTFEKFMQV